MVDFDKQTVLIIDDDESVVNTMLRVFQNDPAQIDYAFTIKDGLAKVEQNNFDVVFLDVNFPDGSGLDIIECILNRALPPQIIIMTAFADQDGAELAIEHGAWDYLVKPVSPKDLRLQLKRALEYQANKKHISKNQKFEAPAIIGSSKIIQTCRLQAAQIAASDANVIIKGQTGTGKELFAKAIHENSARRNGNFIVVDCSVLSENLIESILFGHEKGAFTNADKKTKGLISLAHGGTLFLDEIGELPKSIQSSFLRVLQEKHFRPVGSEQEQYSDFRLICATNRNLDQMASKGLFREDLLYRLKSLVLKLPALKNRREDILSLAKYQADKCCQQQNMPPKELTSEFIEILEKYDWPGNVRELMNVIEATVAQAHENILIPYHLPYFIRSKVIGQSLKNNQSSANAHAIIEWICSEPMTYKEFMNIVEKKYLEAAFLRGNGNIHKMVEQSGVSRAALYNKLKKHNIK